MDWSIDNGEFASMVYICWFRNGKVFVAHFNVFHAPIVARVCFLDYAHLPLAYDGVIVLHKDNITYLDIPFSNVPFWTYDELRKYVSRPSTPKAFDDTLKEIEPVSIGRALKEGPLGDMAGCPTQEEVVRGQVSAVFRIIGMDANGSLVHELGDLSKDSLQLTIGQDLSSYSCA